MVLGLAVILVSCTVFKFNLLVLACPSIFTNKISSCVRIVFKSSKLYLVPIIGTLLSLKKERENKRVTSLNNLLLELLFVGSAIALFYQGSLTFDLIFKLFWIANFLSLALIDLNSRKLPNKIIFALILILIFLIPFWNLMDYERNLIGFSGYTGSIINTSFMFVVLTVFGVGIYYSYPGFIGGGDIKLMLIIGLFFGFPDALSVIYLSVMIGALVSIIKMVIDKNIRSVSIPFGAVLSLSAIIVIVAHNHLTHVYSFMQLM